MLSFMFNILIELFNVVWAFLKLPVMFVAVSVWCILLVMLIFLILGYVEGRRLPRHRRRKIVNSSFLERIFVQLPRQLANDLFDRDPLEFPYKGCVIFTGRQGNGKTIALVEFCRRMHVEYPDCKVISNLDISFQDDSLDHWRKLIDYKNGPLGVVACIDETQNWFSSNQSRNFPPEMLQVITQNRKNRRIILGTAQNFYMLAKNIRSQCTEIRECCTFFGCVTVVRRRQPILDNDGNVVEFKKLGIYFFVHDKELRQSYDTYKVIESLSSSGFKDGADTLQ